MEATVFFVAVMFACQGFALAGSSAYTLADIDAIAKGGAPQLAIQQLEAVRPDYSQNPGSWLRWEQRRIQIHEVEEQWQVIVDRLETPLASPQPSGYQPWRSEQLALAYMQLGRYQQAVKQLDRLIASSAKSMPTSNAGIDRLANWHKMRLRAYLKLRDYPRAVKLAQRWLRDRPVARVDGYKAPIDAWLADTGVQRYQLNFQRAEDAGFAELYAGILLQNDQPEAAIRQLKGVTSGRADVLRLFAQLQAGSIELSTALEQALSMAADSSLPLRTRRNAWLLTADVARSLGDAVIEARAMEQALLLSVGSQLDDELFVINADSLWDAYGRLAIALADELGLPAEVNDDWFVAASVLRETSPLQSRALMSKVAFDADLPRDREIAHRQLAGWVTANSETGGLLRFLYLESRRYLEEGQIPKPVLYALADQALDNEDDKLSAQLMALLDTPPTGTSDTDWLLLRARSHIMAGQPSEGVVDIEAAFASTPGVTKALYGDVLAIMFDLQTIGRHEAAEQFLSRLQALNLEPQDDRELWFWRAESAKAMARHSQAALMYLKSATAFGPFAMDPWAQTSRFNAAESLEKAGFYSDARHIYQSLLSATPDPGRLALLRYKLLQIKAKERNRVGR